MSVEIPLPIEEAAARHISQDPVLKARHEHAVQQGRLIADAQDFLLPHFLQHRTPNTYRPHNKQFPWHMPGDVTAVIPYGERGQHFGRLHFVSAIYWAKKDRLDGMQVDVGSSADGRQFTGGYRVSYHFGDAGRAPVDVFCLRPAAAEAGGGFDEYYHQLRFAYNAPAWGGDLEVPARLGDSTLGFVITDPVDDASEIQAAADLVEVIWTNREVPRAEDFMQTVNSLLDPVQLARAIRQSRGQ